MRTSQRRLHRPGTGATFGLRDCYPAWEALGCTAARGKPLHLERDNPELLQLMFDDHILPSDAHIVDVRRAERPDAPQCPLRPRSTRTWCLPSHSSRSSSPRTLAIAIVRVRALLGAS